MLFIIFQNALAKNRPKFIEDAEKRRIKICQKQDLRKLAYNYNERILLDEIKSNKENIPSPHGKELEQLLYKPGKLIPILFNFILGFTVFSLP